MFELRPDLRGNHEMKRITTFGYLCPTDGTRINGDFDHTIGGLAPSSENEVTINKYPNVVGRTTRFHLKLVSGWRPNRSLMLVARRSGLKRLHSALSHRRCLSLSLSVSLCLAMSLSFSLSPLCSL